MSQTIWLNNNIKRSGRKFIFSHWIQKGIYFINDLLTNDGKFMSFVEFRNLYLLDVNFIEFYSVIDAIPLCWKRLVKKQKKTQNIIHPHVNLLKSSLNPTKPFYQILLAKNLFSKYKSYVKVASRFKLRNK